MKTVLSGPCMTAHVVSKEYYDDATITEHHLDKALDKVALLDMDAKIASYNSNSTHGGISSRVSQQVAPKSNHHLKE